MDIVGKLWNFCHTLRHEGVDYSDYIEELTYLLFLKIANERNVNVPLGCTWEDLKNSGEEDLLRKYNAILKELSKQEGILREIFSEPIAKIHNSVSLKKLLNLIDEINWSSFDLDVLGATFEGLLEKAASESKKGAGQYFTPRPLIKAIVKVMQPDPFESENFKISDIACGTAGFLTESFEWWKNKYKGIEFSGPQLEKIKSGTYYGQELVIRPRRLALMNLYLHGLEPSISLGDTIYEPLPANFMACSCILTNPPFGTRGADQIPDRKFKIKTSNKQLNFIQHAVEILEDQGRAAIVLPDGVLSEDKASELWKYLLEFCNVHTILKLPDGTFTPYANVKANVIFLQKGKKTTDLYVYDLRTNTLNFTKKERPLTEDFFNDFIDCYGGVPNPISRRTETDRFKRFTVDDIIKKNYRLDFSWLKDTRTAIKGYSDPTDLINQVILELEELIEDCKSISDLID